MTRRLHYRFSAAPLQTAFAIAAAVAMVPAAQAQSSVTLYGLVDGGVGYISNIGGKHEYFQSTSVMQADRWGLKGVEDLGGGTSAIFVLENGFSLSNGALGQGGAEFGRQAYVGLRDKKYGTITAGNQYDFMGATLGAYETSTWLLGQYSDHPFANDRTNSLRIANSVQYMTPIWGGFQFGALYGFSNLAGNINGSGRSYSYSASYNAGPWNVAAAYTEVAGTASVLDISSLTGKPAGTVTAGGSYLRTFGVATSYKFQRSFVYAMYTQSLYAGNRGQNLQNTVFRNGEIGATYYITPALQAAAGYVFTPVGATKFHEVTTTLDYSFSKRTDVYATIWAEHAQGTNARASIIGIGVSSGPNQVVADIGIRHKF
jgi:GBP family porin